MPRNAGTRQDTWIIRMFIIPTTGGARIPLGVWDKKTGGGVDSDDVKYNPGGMVPPINLGGKKTTENLTLQRLYDRVDDHEKAAMMIVAAGKGHVTVSFKPMDPDGHEFGKAYNYEGTLKRYSPPDIDSESTSAALLEVEVGVSGYPALI